MEDREWLLYVLAEAGDVQVELDNLDRTISQGCTRLYGSTSPASAGKMELLVSLALCCSSLRMATRSCASMIESYSGQAGPPEQA